MSNPFVAEIRIFAGNFAPRGWALCDGQILAISQNTALFSLIGTFYGGNGTSTFGLPNLQGSAPLGAGNGAGLTPRVIGEIGGEANVTLLSSQMPGHTHIPSCSAGAGTEIPPAGAVWAEAAATRGIKAYASSANTTMAPQAIGAVGGNLPHNNLPPYQVLTFIIALQGIFPARN
jgi:microcystin-dependent protein